MLLQNFNESNSLEWLSITASMTSRLRTKALQGIDSLDPSTRMQPFRQGAVRYDYHAQFGLSSTAGGFGVA
jgi:hypothetical protein